MYRVFCVIALIFGVVALVGLQTASVPRCRRWLLGASRGSII